MDSKQIKTFSSEEYINFQSNNKIDVIDFNIDNKNINVSFLTTNELNIVNSNIGGKEVECKSNIINFDEKSSLFATDKIDLQNDDFNPININAPVIVLNGQEMANEKKSVILKKINDPLALKRLELVNLLRKAKIQCESINSEKVLEYQEKLSVQPVSKVLKK